MDFIKDCVKNKWNNFNKWIKSNKPNKDKKGLDKK